MTADPTVTLPAPAGPPGPAAHARAQLIVGGLAGVALLSAFAGVVTLGVRRAESDHRAQAALHEATWRCNALRVRAERDACRCRLSNRVHRQVPAGVAGCRHGVPVLTMVFMMTSSLRMQAAMTTLGSLPRALS